MRAALVLAIGLALFSIPRATAETAAPPALPPLDGPTEPHVVPERGDDGIYHQTWFNQTFLDLREDLKEAGAEGKRYVIIFEQRGCIYCTKMHKEVLSQRYINDYVRANFRVQQIDLWGSREVTDFDGTKLPEKKLAERWGVMFTPTIIFFKDSLAGLDGKWGPPLEVARMNLGIGAGTFYDMFAWVRAKVYEKDRNFQRFHVARQTQRDEAKAKAKSN